MISDPRVEFKIKINSVEARVFGYGNPKNPPIMYIHGYFRGFSSYIGDLPIRYLMKNYYVISFDLPKYGWSKAFKNPHLEFISDIQKLVLNGKKSTIFGISYGGLVALEYSRQFPEKVNAVIVAGTPVFYGLFNIFKIVKFFPKYQGRKITREIFEEFKFLNSENLSKIKTPVLLYYSWRDFAANVFMGRRLHKLLPNSKLVIAKNQNHKWLLHRIDKSGLLEEINSFLKNS